jgi:hypothetical protein
LTTRLTVRSSVARAVGIATALAPSSTTTFPALEARVQRTALVAVTSPAATPYANGDVAVVPPPARVSTPTVAAAATTFTR